MASVGSIPLVKQTEGKDYHTPPHSTKKDMWNYNSTPPRRHAMVIRHKENI